MRKIQSIDGVSEAIGEMLLLAIAVSVVTVIYMQLSTAQGPEDITNVTIIGKMEQGSPVFELQRGESLTPDTKIIITVAGYDQRIYSVNQSSLRGVSNHDWEIGEQIILPKEDIAGLRVEATIIDQKTNSIVFWGILQDGLVLPARGKGGIWHFDEALWKSIPDEVKDSSGNDNHGIALYGAKIINGIQQPTNVVHLNAGFFDGYLDLVNVDTSWTLNITNTITVEAWMKPQNPQMMVDIIDLEEKFGYTPYIIPMFDNKYAIVSEDQAKRGSLATVDIDPSGNITYIQFVIFGDSTGDQILRPLITQLTQHLYLVSYNDEKLYMHLKTYNISSNGSITYTGNELVFKDYKCSINKQNRPSLQKITENLCAISYWVPSQGGLLRTVNISSTGKITDTGKMIVFDSLAGYDPCLVHVTGNLYGLAYRGVADAGTLKTFTITSTGTITYTTHTVKFDTAKAYEPCLLQVSGKVFAVAYRNSLDDGCIKTFNISSNGSMVWTNNMVIFESTTNCFNPSLVGYENDNYVVAYTTGNSGSTTGYVRQLQLRANGSIVNQDNSRREFKIENRERCYTPILLHITENLFAISFTGPTDHPGELITLLIGEETFPPYRGIFKRNAFGIYANTSTVVGSINNVMVTYPTTAVWHHFAVTYDGHMIRLYVDGSLVNSTIYENHQINKTRYDLRFGRYYCGYIDEVAIYDKPLTSTQLLAHVNNPGALE